MSKKAQMTFTEALDAVLSGYDVYSYDGYKMMNVRGNIYTKHRDNDLKKRLINHDEIQLLKDKKWYVFGDEAWESYTTSLFY